MTTEERREHIEQLRQERSLYFTGTRPMQPARVAAIDAGIAALEREGQMEAQPSPDLESILKLIEVATDCEPVPVAGTAMMGCPQGKLVGCVDAARDALPALSALLAEHEYLHSESMALHLKELNEDLEKAQAEIAQSRAKIALLEAQVDKLAQRLGELSIHHVEISVENERLREENARMKAAITKAAEEGLSHAE